MKKTLALQPCKAEFLSGCFWLEAELPELSNWLTAYGFRIAHATGLQMPDKTPVIAERPLPIQWEFMDWVLWCIEHGQAPYVATLHDENDRSITIYPEPGAGTILRPNDDAAAALLAEVQ